MKFLIIALGLFFSPLMGAHFQVDVPAGWEKEVEQFKDNGVVSEIWFHDEERIVHVTSPLTDGKAHRVDEVIATFKAFDFEDELIIVEKSDSEAILDLGDGVMRIIVNDNWFHSLSYNSEKPFDHEYWIHFIKEAKIV
jgi:hypothetical protein